MKKFLNVLVIVFLSIIICSVLYSRLIKHDMITYVFEKAFFIVETGSMEPTINSGELIIVSKEKKYKVGDIVTIFDNDKDIFTHRIVEITNDSVVTKGDANNLIDGIINSKNIVGKVIIHSKILGFFVIYLLKPLILVDILYICLKLIIELYKTEEEKNEEKLNC